jgi:hypothetical protein
VPQLAEFRSNLLCNVFMPPAFGLRHIHTGTRAIRPLIEHCGDTLPICRHHRVGGIEHGQQLTGKPATRRIGWHPVIDPVLLAKTLEQSAIAEELEVARHARLTLTEDLRQLGHRELAERQHGKHAQAGGLGH